MKGRIWFFKVFNGLVFHSPTPNAIAVFDDEGSAVLLRTILRDLSYTPIPVRGGYYCGFRVATKTLKIFLRSRKYHRFGAYEAYVLACLELIKPRIVVTWIDNSYLFQAVSRIYKGAEFIAVQNGTRGPPEVAGPDLLKGGNLPARPHPASHISMPTLFCWGPFEGELYRQYGHQIDEFVPCGPYMGGYYRAEVRSAAVQTIDFELCLLSQHTDFSTPSYQRSLRVLQEFVKNYAAETGASLCVAIRSSNPAELAYFRDIFGDATDIPPHDRPGFSTYRLMDRSHVILGLDSTANFEAFSWGKKVLFCNFTGDASFDLAPGVWEIHEESYGLFKEKLTRLREMTQEDYLRASQACREHRFSYDPHRPAHVVIRERILKAVEP